MERQGKVGNFGMMLFFWNGLQPGNGPFLVYFGVAVQKIRKEKKERVCFGGHF